MSNTPEFNKRLFRLPNWARRHIAHLEFRVETAEATIPWTEPGMQWFTLLKDAPHTKLFTCSSDGTHCIATIGAGDRVFVGRAKRKDTTK